MNRSEVEALQAEGVRVDVFTERCPCGRNGWYIRALDRYVHVDGSANTACWVALARGETPEPTVSQRDSLREAS